MIDKIRHSLKNNFKKRYYAWLDRRSPLTNRIKLSQKRIYIVPNRVGLLYLALVVLMFVNGVNYQNNLIFSFSVLLLSIFITSIVVTYQNLSGLIIESGLGESVFAGRNTILHVSISHESRQVKEGLCLGFSRETAMPLTSIESKHAFELTYRTTKRGLISVPRITLYSVYPLGLLRCWTWMRLQFKGVVYPEPVFLPYQYLGVSSEGDEQAVNVVSSGVDDFRGFRKYQSGDSLKHVAWRQFAKNNKLLTKEFEQAQAIGHWLDWEALSGFGGEYRLQVLCGWVINSNEENREYGLSLPGIKIDVGRGDQHKEQCLTALALYGLNTGGNK